MSAQTDPQISHGSRVRLHPWVVVEEEGRNPILGCQASRRYLDVNRETLIALEILNTSDSVDEAELRTAARLGDEYDLLELAWTLAERGFIDTVDGEPVPNGVAEARERHPWLYSVSTEQLAWIRSPWVRWLLAALVAIWFLVMLQDPHRLPHPRDLFFADDPLVVPLVAFASLMALAYVHELAHFAMARSHGIEATIRASRRFHIAVLETDVTNAWQLEPRARLSIFLAGPALNVVALTTSGLVLALLDPRPGSAFERALRFVAYINVYPLVFQLAVFARTDLYFVLLALTGERNLLADTRSFVIHGVRRRWLLLRGAAFEPCPACGTATLPDDPHCPRCGGPALPGDPERWGFRWESRRYLRTFGAVLVTGYTLGAAFVATFGLAAQERAWRMGFRRLDQAAGTGDWRHLVASLLFLLLYGAQAALLIWVLGRALWRLLLRFLPGGRRAAAEQPHDPDSPDADPNEPGDDMTAEPPASRSALPLTLDRLPRYLLDEHLVSPAELVDLPGLSVQDRSRRNRGFLVQAGQTTRLVVKQAGNLGDPDAVATVLAEAQVLQAVARDDALRPLRWFAPEVVHINWHDVVLVTRMVHPATNLTKLHLNGGEFQFPVDAAVTAGRMLATFHHRLGEAARHGFLPPLAEREPFAFDIPRYARMAASDGSPAATAFVRMLDETGVYDDLTEVRALHANGTDVIHGDVRWDNMLVTAGAGPREGLNLRLIDWELVGRGDGAWDLGCLMAEVLRFWCTATGMRAGRLRPGMDTPSAFDLADSHEATRALVDAYCRSRRFSARNRADLLARVQAYLPYLVTISAFELLQGSDELPTTSALALDLAREAQTDPAAAMESWFGINQKQEVAA
jgi:putative peptide zinc metalloprotease protein